MPYDSPYNLCIPLPHPQCRSCCHTVHTVYGSPPAKDSALMDVSPKYMLLGGVIGAFITLTVIVSMDQLGPARAAQLIVVSQIAAAYLIELFGLFGVDKANFQWSKVLGLGLSIIGIMIVKWK